MRKIDEVGVVGRLDQIVNILEKRVGLHTPEYREWLGEYDKERGTALGRIYNDVEEFFNDRETLIEIAALDVKCEALQRELLTYLCFDLSRERIHKSRASILHMYSIRHRGYWFHIVRDRIWVESAEESGLDVSPRDIGRGLK